MAENGQADDPITCWACTGPLTEGQKYCTACEHWQNWRRHTVFSTSILSLLVALVTVISFAAEPVSKLFSSPKTLMHVGGSLRVQTSDMAILNNGYRGPIWSAEVDLKFDNIGDTHISLGAVLQCKFDGLSADLKSFETGLLRVNGRETLRYQVNVPRAAEDQVPVPSASCSLPFTAQGKSAVLQIEFLDQTILTTEIR